ncbi:MULTISPECIES: hypothetical protein [unclassified Streptomyces]|uniref:hypothetical protein n=1 Tax=unclassified Streptomyces TaxID=2593676 RepID=UPI00331D37F4
MKSGSWRRIASPGVQVVLRAVCAVVFNVLVQRLLSPGTVDAGAAARQQAPALG